MSHPPGVPSSGLPLEFVAHTARNRGAPLIARFRSLSGQDCSISAASRGRGCEGGGKAEGDVATATATATETECKLQAGLTSNGFSC